MNEIELKFRVGRIMLNGRPYPFTEPVIRGPFKWIHIIPESYSPDNLKNSMMYLFENTWEGKVEMKFWLRENYLLRHFTNMEYHHNRMILYNNTQTSENKKNHRKKTKDHIKKKTDEFISELKDPKYNGIKISNPNLMDELNKPAHLADGPILSSSLVYKDTNFQCPEPATTDDVMYLNNLTFISDLDGVPFNNWFR